MELDPEQPDRRAIDQRRRGRVLRIGVSGEGEVLGIGAGHETGLAAQQRHPGIARRIDRAEHDERELAIEVAVLVGHVVADHPATECLHPLGHADRSLQRDFARMKR